MKTFKPIPSEEIENVKLYYQLHIKKSIEEFNLILDLLKFKDMFYSYLDESDIPMSDTIYLILEDTTFYLDSIIKGLLLE